MAHNQLIIDIKFNGMYQGSNISFDLQLNIGNQDNNPDYLDRIKQEIRLLEIEQEELQSQLAYIEANPHELISTFQNKLLKRIGELREENEGIQQLIEKSRIPGYAEMTKKKSNYMAETPNSKKKHEDDWNQFDRRNPFDQVEISQKMEASTCQNFPIHNTDNPLRTLQPLQDNQLRARAQLTAELLQVINKTSEIKSEMEKLETPEEPLLTLHEMAMKSKNVQEISKYKQRLLQLLRKLKSRQATQEQIVREYQRMYDTTLKQLKQATQLLNQLTSMKTTDNLDDLFAEVLQLEQRLAYINEQLQRIDQTQWLKDIQTQLIQALKRLGITPPKTVTNCIDQLRQNIDNMAEILMECALVQRGDEKQKLSLLKIYYEEEKENNKKIIKSLQNKEQGLSKKLIDLQMNN